MKLKFFTTIVYLLFVALSVHAETTENEQKKLAVYVTGESSDQIKSVSQNKISTNLIKSGQYQLIERSSDFLKALNQEQEYQLSGSVDDSQITDIGKQFGADFVCVVSINNFGTYLQLTMRMVDVVKAIATESSEGEIGNYKGFMDLDGVINPVIEDLLRGRKLAETTRTKEGKASTPIQTTATSSIVYQETFTVKDAEKILNEYNIDYKNEVKIYKARKLRNAGWWTLTGTIVIGFVDIVTDLYDGEVAVASALVGIPAGITCITLGSVRMSNRKKELAKSLVSYQPMYESDNYSLAFGVGSGCVGLSLQF